MNDVIEVKKSQDGKNFVVIAKDNKEVNILANKIGWFTASVLITKYQDHTEKDYLLAGKPVAFPSGDGKMHRAPARAFGIHPETAFENFKKFADRESVKNFIDFQNFGEQDAIIEAKKAYLYEGKKSWMLKKHHILDCQEKKRYASKKKQLEKLIGSKVFLAGENPNIFFTIKELKDGDGKDPNTYILVLDNGLEVREGKIISWDKGIIKANEIYDNLFNKFKNKFINKNYWLPGGESGVISIIDITGDPDRINLDSFRIKGLNPDKIAWSENFAYKKGFIKVSELFDNPDFNPEANGEGEKPSPSEEIKTEVVEVKIQQPKVEEPKIEVKTTTTLESLEKQLEEEAKKKDASKRTTTKKKEEKKEEEKPVEVKPVQPAMAIYTEEELQELNTEDIEDIEEVEEFSAEELDSFDKYYKD